MRDYGAIDTCEANTGGGIRKLPLNTYDRTSYRPPRRNMPIICSFCPKGFCSLYNRGIGKIKMTISDNTLQEAIIVAATGILTQ